MEEKNRPTDTREQKKEHNEEEKEKEEHNKSIFSALIQKEFVALKLHIYSRCSSVICHRNALRLCVHTDRDHCRYVAPILHLSWNTYFRVLLILNICLFFSFFSHSRFFSSLKLL